VLKNSRIFLVLKEQLLIQRKSSILLLAISLISSSMVVVQPLLMQKLIDEAFVPKNIEAMYFFASIIITLGIFGIFLSSYTQYSYTKLSTKLLFDFRSNIFEKIFLNKKMFFQKYKVGDLLSRLEADISAIQRFGTDSIFSLTTALFGLIGAVIIMYSFDPMLCIFSLCLLPIEFFILKPLYPKMTNRTRDLRQSTASLGSYIIESLRYAQFFKTFNSINKRVDQLNIHQDENKYRILEQQKLQILFSQLPVIIALIGRSFIVFWGGYKVIQEDMLLGEFIAFLTYFGIILGPIQSILGFLNSMPKIKVSLERLEVILPRIHKDIVYKEIQHDVNINIKDADFSYFNNTIFKNLNVDIPYGKKIILRGDNGSGKSTFFDILLNLVDLQKGSVKIADIDIQNIKPEVLYKIIARVEQEPIIIASTLRDNLNLINNTISDKELLQTLEEVGLFTWYKGLEKGLDTLLIENGQSLSCGQKQRLAIARVVLLKPSIVLLDEYTSSLDIKSTENMQDLIDKLFSNNTRIIITHKKIDKEENMYKILNKTITSIKD
jgi:ATP-binding cassette subfamily B protein